MSSIGTGYDLAASTFSPDGRIFQIEYAQKAVDNSETMIALRGKNGVVCAVEKAIPSKLYQENSKPRMMTAAEHLGLGLAGVYPDCRAIRDYAVEEGLKYLRDYRCPIPDKKLAATLAEYVHMFTLGISRPFGCSVFVNSWDKKDGGKIFLIEPSGLSYEYRAWAVGKNRQAAKAEIEKLKLDELEMDQLVKEAVRIIMAIRDEGKDKNVTIEMSWVGENTKGNAELVPNATIDAAEEWARRALDEDDLDD
ncbi:unnamed protein product, partial [Mesorhabditis belari]|uniref:Proteasome subunit alpha type n=1 Tax=Mesorhabditis belari TaxID=2138241 RepID=A0AAF3FFD4_9BILA